MKNKIRSVRYLMYLALTLIIGFSSCNDSSAEKGSKKPDNVLPLQRDVEEKIIGKWITRGGIEWQGLPLIPKYEMEFTDKKVYINMDKLDLSYGLANINIKHESSVSDYTIDGDKVIIESNSEFFILKNDSILSSQLIIEGEVIQIKLYR